MAETMFDIDAMVLKRAEREELERLLGRLDLEEAAWKADMRGKPMIGLLEVGKPTKQMSADALRSTIRERFSQLRQDDESGPAAGKG